MEALGGEDANSVEGRLVGLRRGADKLMRLGKLGAFGAWLVGALEETGNGREGKDLSVAKQVQWAEAVEMMMPASRHEHEE